VTYPTSATPTISVVIPNYNNAGTLARAIDSVLAQDHPAHEIIVVDDGSTDDSRRVAAAFGDRIRFVRQPNGGVSSARNHGVRIATGDWIAFLDADDVYLPGRLSAHARWIAREPDVDFLLADQEFRDADGKLRQLTIDACAAGRALLARHPGAVEMPLAKDDFEAMVADGFAEIRTLTLPRATFLALGGFPAEHKIGEDLYFFIRLFAASRRGGVVNLPLAVYYIYPDSALRRDPILSQRRYVAALEALGTEMRSIGGALRRGWQARLRQGRLSLAYMYLRRHDRRRALAAVTPQLWTSPSLAALRDIASIVRGFA